ncbi:uncharacterized protein LOC117327714 isoform X2 [Pecten maximus]|uniref:uncharacterized protein LOC117327714 isoform X2 n=1 Tax=Pecten maximus TaxID=6579 RepID=UPI0014589068|nr:uncharacterized protein LOC117327714 isoform X2 [Pecten maximus]
MIVLLTALAVIFGTVNGQTTCADEVDPNICRLLASESFGLKDICTDPCLSRTCQKTCGKCPLECYSCHSVSSPSDCTTTTPCPSKDHNCIVTESYNDNFEKTFALGCATKDVCLRNFGGTIGKRSQLDGGCCGSNLCNHNLTSSTQPLAGIILTTPGVTLAPNPSVAPSAVVRSSCDDFNSELCTQLAFAMPDICSNECIASKVCPSMCGKCLTCYHCDNVELQSDCSAKAKCNPGQKCYITETYNSMTFQHGFRTGCIDNNLCSNLTFGSPDIGTGPALIGRRSHFHFSLDGDCCGSDLCNDRVQTTVAPVVTTPAPAVVMTTQGPVVTNQPNATPRPQDCNWNGDCPRGFHAYLNKCYYFGDNEMEWDDALGYCKERCSHLAELKSDNELQDVMNHFRHNPSAGYDTDVEYYVGAVDRGVGRWTWFYSGDEVDRDLITPSFHAHKYDHCANVFFDEYDDGFGIDNVLCDEVFRPMCEVNRA